MTIHQFPRTDFDLPMEVLGVLKRQAEPSIGEMAHDIEMRVGQQFERADYERAIERLEALGYEIIDYPDVDVTRYSLVTTGDAA